MNEHFAARFIAWAVAAPTVQAVIQIGSRTRPPHTPGAADAASDWDFQIVTSDLSPFLNGSCLTASGAGEPAVFTLRPGRLGTSPKIGALYPEGQLEVVLLPLERVQALFAFGANDRRAENRSGRDLVEIAMIYAGGFKFLKDTIGAERSVTALIAAHPVPPMPEAEIANHAYGFLCDASTIRAQINRGELRAAQRFLHAQLAETNFGLLQELARREGRLAFHDARRLEATTPPEWVEAVTVEATPQRAALEAAVDKATATCRRLCQALLHDPAQKAVVERAFARVAEIKTPGGS